MMKYVFLFSIIGLVAACHNMDNQSGNTEAGRKDSIRAAAMADTANFTTIQWLDSIQQKVGKKVNEGQVVEISWHFKNTGNRPLIIDRVEPG